MIKGTSEYLEDLAQNYRCPEHDNPLAVAWNAQENCHVLRCSAGHFPEEIKRILSLTQELKTGADIAEPLKHNIEKGIQKRAARIPQAPQAETFAGIPAADLGTGELVPIEKLKRLVQWAEKFDLVPALGHVCIMYGNPYITIDGYLFHARRSGEPYQLKSHPLSEDERRTYQINTGDHAWISEITMDEGRRLVTGLGIVTADEMTARSSKNPERLRSPVVAAHPWQLTQKRSEWQALRRAFPIGAEQQFEEESK